MNQNSKSGILLFVLLNLLFINKAIAQFGPTELISDDHLISNHMTAADLNGDGSLDIIVSSQGDLNLSTYEYDEPGKLVWYANDGLGNFGAQQLIDIPADGSFDIVAVDMDNDGDQDLLVGLDSDNVGPGENGTFLFTNLDGLGNFDNGIEINPYYLILDAVVDIDNDGDMDILSGHNDGVSLIKNVNGVFQDAVSIVSNFPAYSLDMDVADIDGDGDNDLVVGGQDGSATDARLAWFENINGSDEFSSTPNMLSTQNYSGKVRLADIDNDGDQDLVAVAYGVTPGLAWFENDGTSLIDTANEIYVSNFSFPKALLFGDVNLDGTLDILIPFLGAFNFIWFPQSQEPGVFEDFVTGNQISSWTREGFLGDFDGDGDLDYICTLLNDELHLYRNYILDAQANVSGITYWDLNENGNLDPGEIGLENQIVSLEPTGIDSWTAGAGTYSYLALAPGSYDVECDPASNWETTTSDEFQFWVLDSTNIVHNFGLRATQQITKATIGMASAPTRCGFTIPFWLESTNSGTETIDGSISLEVDPLVTFVNANPAPDNISGNTLTWSFDDLPPTYSHKVILELEMPPADFLGEYLSFNSTIDVQNQTGSGTFTDTETYSSIIACSYDPNDKQTEPNLIGDNYTLIGDTLTYTIRFQNTGTDTAFTVRVEDQLSDYLRTSRFEMIAASHPYVLHKTDDDKLVFTFENILLPDSSTNEIASHGFVKFKIPTWTNIPSPTEQLNSAEIYFDFNDPIITNTVLNIMVDTFPFEVNVQQPSCFENTDGSLFLSSPFFETDQFTYQWSNNASSDTISNLSEGIYSVTVLNDDGNLVFTATTGLTQPESLTLFGSETPATIGQQNGTATVEPEGGTAPYTYSWDTQPLQTTATIENLIAGEYTVSVTDANDCQNSIIVTVGETVSNNTIQKERISLSILPNPSEGQFEVLFDLNQKAAWTMNIYDVVGRLVKSKEGTNSAGKVSFSGLSSGMYILNLHTHKELRTWKIVVR